MPRTLLQASTICIPIRPLLQAPDPHTQPASRHSLLSRHWHLKVSTFESPQHGSLPFFPISTSLTTDCKSQKPGCHHRGLPLPCSPRPYITGLPFLSISRSTVRSYLNSPHEVGESSGALTVSCGFLQAEPWRMGARSRTGAGAHTTSPSSAMCFPLPRTPPPSPR